MVSPVPKRTVRWDGEPVGVTMRLASIALVLVGAIADATGAHALAYYALVAAVPTVALAALWALGDVLDGTAALAADRAGAMLIALALPFVLLGTAVRAPLLAEGPPPAIGVTAVVIALALFAAQTLVAVTAAAPRSTARANERSGATL
jgi:hypothetical protein